MARLAGQLGYPSSRDEVERRLQQILSRPEHAVWVAEVREGRDRDAKIGGWLHAYVARTVESDPTVEIGGLVVDERRRSSGIGRALMGHAEQWGRDQRCPTVTVRSNVVRERAHAFYQKLGYALIKSQRIFRKTL